MVRAIGSVVAGYLTMFVFVLVSFTVAYLVMGTNRTYEPGTFNVSMLWLAVSTVLGVAGAVLGGAVCAMIAKSCTPPKVLAGLALVLGLALAIPVFMGTQPDPGPRTADVTAVKAMSSSRQPKWVAATNPVLGAAGILIGAGLVRKGKKGEGAA